VSTRVGSIELACIPDAVGMLAEVAEAYPDVPEDDWAPYRALYPELFRGPSWRLPCNAYLVRSGGTTVLVDTGVGPPGLWDWTAEEEGRLPAALEELGVTRDGVDVVFLTHLHIDHLGWNTDLEGDVFFPPARYLVHEDAVAYARRRAELPHVRRCVEPLVDRFQTVAGDVELAPGVTTVALPGHYPGHLGLRLESEGEQALLMADVAVHPALLDHPEWRYVSDLDYDECVATRRAVLPELVDRDVLAVCGHYPGTGIGRVLREDGRVVWKRV
jgi:glyoxylase-like metal-dependent hydrolase (beta-lactamase superfamily II)